MKTLTERFKRVNWLHFTYGVLPSWEEFESQYMQVVGFKVYQVRNCPMVGNRDFTDLELYKYLQQLVSLWDNGDEDAGDWVSCVLQTLNIEWI